MKLETERLILRDFVKEDWRRAFEYESDSLYLRYYEWTERTPESVQEFIGWFLAHQQQEPRFKFQLAITLKSNNLLIGSCGVRMDKVDAVEAEMVTNWIPNTGIKVTPARPHTPWWTSGSAALVYIVFGRTALRTTSLQLMCWRNWA